MKLEVPIIALMIASFVFVVVFGFMNHMADTYSIAGFSKSNNDIDALSINNGSKSFEAAFDRAESATNLSNTMQEKIGKVKLSFGSAASDAQTLGSLGYDIIKSLVNGLLFIKDMMSAIIQILGISNISIFFAILVVVIVMAAIRMIMGIGGD